MEYAVLYLIAASFFSCGFLFGAAWRGMFNYDTEGEEE